MSINHHNPYVDNVTDFKAADMNPPLSELDEALTALNSNTYDIGGSFVSVPNASQLLLIYPAPRVFNFLASMPGSQMVAKVAATAETVFSIKKNNVEFATATFAIAGTVATFVAGASVSFAAGDILTLVAPGSPDATLANLGWALAASRLTITTTSTTTTTTTSSSTTTTTTA